MRQLFLPLGLFCAIPAALFLPGGGELLDAHYGIQCLVLIIFVISGYQSGNSRDFSRLNPGWILLYTACITLILSPLLGTLLSVLIGLPPDLAIGLIVIAAVPPTLSSGIVITALCGGSKKLALFLTISLNILGIFSIPFVLKICLQTTGSVTINQLELLGRMLFLVLLPFLAGRTIQIFTKKATHSPLWNYINSSCVIVIVYTSLAVSRNAFFDITAVQYSGVILSVITLHSLLLLSNAGCGKILQLPPAQQKAVVFVASQKTLPVSITILASIPGPTGSAVIVCLMLHFIQLVMDSFLAGHWAGRR